mmetsp:Transcript_12213/g.36392  ORF Transcript_12213/g.36392 Transcript_12213/m.36392 type:complete len:278 (+) Transcript_12213:1086-1919(+)
MERDQWSATSSAKAWIASAAAGEGPGAALPRLASSSIAPGSGVALPARRRVCTSRKGTGRGAWTCPSCPAPPVSGPSAAVASGPALAPPASTAAPKLNSGGAAQAPGGVLSQKLKSRVHRVQAGASAPSSSSTAPRGRTTPWSSEPWNVRYRFARGGQSAATRGQRGTRPLAHPASSRTWSRTTVGPPSPARYSTDATRGCARSSSRGGASAASSPSRLASAACGFCARAGAARAMHWSVCISLGASSRSCSCCHHSTPAMTASPARARTAGEWAAR